MNLTADSNSLHFEDSKEAFSARTSMLNVEANDVNQDHFSNQCFKTVQVIPDHGNLQKRQTLFKSYLLESE